MANQFAHAHTDDPLGLATASDIILVSVSGGVRKEWVEVLSELGVYIKDTTLTPKAIKPVEEFTIEYEVRKSSLVIPLGVMINTNYLITSVSAKSDSGSYPTARATVIKFSNANKLLATPSAPGDLTIVGGYGLVNKWGATVTGGISASTSVSMQQVEALEETSGDYMEEGYVQYGFKQEITIESYTALSDANCGTATHVTSRDTGTGRDKLKTFSVSFFKYLP